MSTINLKAFLVTCVMTTAPALAQTIEPHTGPRPTKAPASAPSLTDQLALALARDLHNRGQLDDAEKQLHAVYRRGVLGVEGLTLLGEIAREREDWTAAETYFRGALDLAPTRAGLYLRLGQTLQSLDRIAEADAAFARYSALNGGAP